MENPTNKKQTEKADHLPVTHPPGSREAVGKLDEREHLPVPAGEVIGLVVIEVSAEAVQVVCVGRVGEDVHAVRAMLDLTAQWWTGETN